MDLFVGMSGYSYAKWIGSFYRAKLPAMQMLPFTARSFAPRATAPSAASRPSLPPNGEATGNGRSTEVIQTS
jgi:hypothetical protein